MKRKAGKPGSLAALEIANYEARSLLACAIAKIEGADLDDPVQSMDEADCVVRVAHRLLEQAADRT